MHAKQITLTLVLYLTLALSLAAANASHDARRSHVNLNRILKKRAPQATKEAAENATPSGPLAPLIGAAGNPAGNAAAAPVSASNPAPSVPSPSPSSGLIGGLASGISDGLNSIIPTTTTTSSSSSSSSASLSSSVAPSVVTVSTSSTPSPTPTPESAQQQSTSVVQGKVTRTEAVGASETSATPQQAGATQTKNNTVMALIIVGASLGGIVILWTVFRKWKLSRSSKVDQRMQPIDWQPTNADDALPGSFRRQSGSSFRSAHSGHGAGSDDGHSSHGHGRLGALPDHDFTAGSANLAPVGGYADLARGRSPSPQPQMYEAHSQGPLTRPNYDGQVPLHHQAGYGQDAYNYRY